MDLGIEEILTLLGRFLVSNSPLTDLVFKNMGVTDDVSKGIGIKKMIQVKGEGNTEAESKETHVNLILNKSTNKVSFVEVGEEFVNVIFSFLTLPLGSLIKLQTKKSFLECVDNLYQSAENLSLDNFKSEECKNILISPKLAPFFGYTGSMLEMDEIAPRESSCRGCYVCCWRNDNTGCSVSECAHGVKQAYFRLLNPKSPEGSTEIGGGYAKGKFLVTTDLCVSQLSASSSIQIIKNQDISLSDLVMKRATFGEIQALDLLRSAVTSKTPIDDVLNTHQKVARGNRRSNTWALHKLPSQSKRKVIQNHNLDLSVTYFTMEKVTVNFLVGKVKQRVVLVEADSNFVDILFSLCDFPLGTIVRLLNKQSYSGCLDKLYESIENLNVQNFQAKACKIMLLFPQSAAADG
ncbi:uncharacterized protein A4U43_C10F930 [Asparagus officinalis]|uniref:DUF674 family protein n=1 Tax=Asparagus officinalis TaxID=4686 RepID=A0A5P1DZR9_ASPOF|nr:uncharacterized protein A4U43_C10F930 [Asparagus officinalis]